ncbi:MAG: zinc-ribbon domain-containing protein [Lachnospiraceae bacterium]|nr:zinc-ribbon domain-containing protein [Lachnospiraceae bacterium]
MAICNNCGNTIKDGSLFCPVCGTPLMSGQGQQAFQGQQDNQGIQNPQGMQFQQADPMQQAGYQYQQSAGQMQAGYQYQQSAGQMQQADPMQQFGQIDQAGQIQQQLNQMKQLSDMPVQQIPPVQQQGYQYQQSPGQAQGYQYQQPAGRVQQPVGQMQQPQPQRAPQSSGSSRQKAPKPSRGSSGGGGLPLPVLIAAGVAALAVVVVLAIFVIKFVSGKIGSKDTKGNDTALTELLDTTAATYYLGGGDASTDGDTSAGAVSGDEGSGSSDGASGSSSEIPTGDGMVSEEDLQKGYVWLDKVKTNVFDTSYEELVDWFGVDGEFEKEDHNDTYDCDMRYYTWYSKDDNTHTIYFNLGERDPENKPGVYTITGFNANGWDTQEAADKYLEDVKAKASEMDKEAAANAETGELSFDIFPFGEKENGVNVSLELPSGWSFNDKNEIVDNEDPDAFGAGFMKFEIDDEESFFDRSKDSFENLKDIDEREIGGVKMKGRTYSYVGYDWTQYIGQYADGKVISIGIVGLDLSDGTMADNILKSVTFK